MSESYKLRGVVYPCNRKVSFDLGPILKHKVDISVFVFFTKKKVIFLLELPMSLNYWSYSEFENCIEKLITFSWKEHTKKGSNIIIASIVPIQIFKYSEISKF